jgi:hypothetical protein
MPKPPVMGKKASDGEGKAKKVKRLGIATVVKPCLIGSTILIIAAAALPS